jgi:hypothetical protein
MNETTEIRGGLERLGLIALLPVLIAITAAGYTYQGIPDPPTRYLATTVIRPPTTVQDSASEVNLFLADLSELITTDATVNYVLDQVPGLERQIYLDRIDAARRGTTSSVALSFVHGDEAIAAATVSTLARRVLDDAARGKYEKTQFLLGRATERLERAEEAMQEFLRGTTVFDPEFEYRSVLGEIAQLDQQIATGQALSYGETYQSELTARRTELEATLPELGAAMVSHQRLSAELETAQAAWENATFNNDLEEFEYRTVNSLENLITSEEVVPFVDQTPRLQNTALAAAVALSLSLIAILPFSAWLGRPRGRHKMTGDRVTERTVDLIALAKEGVKNEDLANGSSNNVGNGADDHGAKAVAGVVKEKGRRHRANATAPQLFDTDAMAQTHPEGRG